MLRRFATAVALLALVSACAPESTERVPADAPGYVNGKAVHPSIKIGKPYRVGDEVYRPHYDPSYVEEGMASWYGPDFHGKSTANGERYNQWAMTAAHRTLPMPSMVKVTNLKNGKSIMVRVNDRGPFSSGRIIDLSRAAAEELDMIGAGTARVRLEYLKPETEQYIAKLQLDKPSEWTQGDVEMAQKDTLDNIAQNLNSQLGTSSGASSFSFNPRGTSEAPIQVSMNDLPPPQQHASDSTSTPAHHPIQPAGEVPKHFAFNAPFRSESTVQQRGVDLVEVGYADNAFSVLSEAHADVRPVRSAPSATVASPAPEARYSFGASDPPTGPPSGSASGAVRMANVPPSSGTWSFDSTTSPPAARTSVAHKAATPHGVRYYVQAGTFSSQENADRLANKLSAVADVDVSEWPIDGKTLYRVRLGPTAHQSAADELIDRLHHYGIHDAKLVTER